MRRALLAALAALALAPATAAAQHGGHGAAPSGGTAVSIQFASFTPPFVDVLTGESIRWTNDSVRQHDVAAVDAGFNSGGLLAGGAYTHAFTAPGDVAYYCTIHPFMRGTVAVHDLLLDKPAESAVPGRAFPVRGRSALAPGTPVTIEADEGSGFMPVGTATTGADGAFAAGLHPHAPAQLRAVSGLSLSPAVPLLVLDRKVAASQRTRRGRTRVTVRVTPPGNGIVVLQLHLRERFGWWPVGRARLRGGHATFSLKARRVRARVVLTLADGATPLAISAPLRLGR